MKEKDIDKIREEIIKEKKTIKKKLVEKKELIDDDNKEIVETTDEELVEEKEETTDELEGGASTISSEEYGILKNLKLFFYGLPKSEDPKYHCNKPDNNKIQKILKNKVDKSLRNNVKFNVDWDKNKYKQNCNRKILKNINYCEKNQNDIGFSRKNNKFYKKCKLKNDEKSCIIM